MKTGEYRRSGKFIAEEVGQVKKRMMIKETRATYNAKEIQKVQKIIARAEIFKERETYVGLCPELNVSSFGSTPEEAKKCLSEAILLFLEECQNMGTLDDVLKEAGFIPKDKEWFSPEPISIGRLGLDLMRA